jgi:hypothetical protein
MIGGFVAHTSADKLMDRYPVESDAEYAELMARAPLEYAAAGPEGN